MGSEKRKFTRFYLKMAAELEVGGKVYQVEELSNLGIGGCLFPVSAGAHGDDCIVKIFLGPRGSSPVVYIEGKIARIDKSSTAVKFSRIDPENLDHLQKIALYNSPDPDKVEQEIKEHPGLF